MHKDNACTSRRVTIHRPLPNEGFEARPFPCHHFEDELTIPFDQHTKSPLVCQSHSAKIYSAPRSPKLGIIASKALFMFSASVQCYTIKSTKCIPHKPTLVLVGHPPVKLNDNLCAFEASDRFRHSHWL